MKKLLKFLNGKKTFIGLAFYFIVGGLKQIGVLDEATSNQLVLLADGIIGVGVLHKLQKAL